MFHQNLFSFTKSHLQDWAIDNLILFILPVPPWTRILWSVFKVQRSVVWSKRVTTSMSLDALLFFILYHYQDQAKAFVLSLVWNKAKSIASSAICGAASPVQLKSIECLKAVVQSPLTKSSTPSAAPQAGGGGDYGVIAVAPIDPSSVATDDVKMACGGEPDQSGVTTVVPIPDLPETLIPSLGGIEAVGGPSIGHSLSFLSLNHLIQFESKDEKELIQAIEEALENITTSPASPMEPDLPFTEIPSLAPSDEAEEWELIPGSSE